MVDAELLQILACPKCRATVKLETVNGKETLLCQNAACGLRYPVRDDIPVMLIDEAESPSQRRSV